MIRLSRFYSVHKLLIVIVSLTISSCGGGGSNSNITNPNASTGIKANLNVDATSSYTLRKTTLYVDSTAISTLNGFNLAIGYSDFNHDGKVDVFLASGDGSQNRTPVQFLINNGSNVFSNQASTIVSNASPGAVHARKVLIGDYNGDGLPDVFVLAHGYDQPPFPGEYPLLFLSNGNGTLHYSNSLENLVGYHHGGASADINGDGNVDIFVTDTSAPFFLINDGHGNFTKSSVQLPSELNNKPLFTAELIDIDKDGYVDLIVGGHEFAGMPTTIYWGDSSGVYSASNKTVLPAVSSWGVVLDFAAEDITGSGQKDILINRTGSTNFYVGRYIQILRQTSNRQFVDETSSRITMDTTQAWFPWMRVQDFDGDGHLDIFIDDKGYCSTGQCAWRNNGNGIFVPYSGPIVPKL